LRLSLIPADDKKIIADMTRRRKMKKGIILILLIILPFIAMADNQKMIALVEIVLDHQLKGMDIKQDLINLESQAEDMESETDALLLASWASLIRITTMTKKKL